MSWVKKDDQKENRGSSRENNPTDDPKAGVGKACLEESEVSVMLIKMHL